MCMNNFCKVVTWNWDDLESNMLPLECISNILQLHSTCSIKNSEQRRWKPYNHLYYHCFLPYILPLKALQFLHNYFLTKKHSCCRQYYYYCLFMDWDMFAIMKMKITVEGLTRSSVIEINRSWWVTTYMGKPSTVGQPTRPTQPFILSGSINE